MCGTKPVPYLGGKLRLPRGTTCQAELQTKFAFYLIDSFVFGRYAEPRTGDFFKGLSRSHGDRDAVNE